MSKKVKPTRKRTTVIPLTGELKAVVEWTHYRWFPCSSDLSKPPRKPKRKQLFAHYPKPPHENGGACRCTVTLVAQGVYYGRIQAIAYCSTGDKYNEATGERISLFRLLRIVRSANNEDRELIALLVKVLRRYEEKGEDDGCDL